MIIMIALMGCLIFYALMSGLEDIRKELRNTNTLLEEKNQILKRKNQILKRKNQILKYK